MPDLPPRIGLTTYREQAIWGVWDEPADLLPATYADAVSRAGGVPLLLPPTEVETAAAAALAGLDGLLLAGGADIDPSRYDAARDEHTGPERADRDGWELALIGEALRIDLPVLGVCRGMQVMAVALGGTLTQHLPDAVGNTLHQPVVGEHGRHEVTVAAASRLQDIIGPTSSVPTYHHQAVDRLPADVVATAWSADRTVEAFEVCDKTWAIGVQWHPEVRDGEALFSAFVSACRDWRAGHRDGRQPVKAEYAGEAL
jgi:gamma-glutamyl-gamma-aminobutyrate hydrolase PuuD